MSILTVFTEQYNRNEHQLEGVRADMANMEGACDELVFFETDTTWVVQCVIAAANGVEEDSGVGSVDLAPPGGDAAEIEDDARRLVVLAAESMIGAGTTANHCWAWSSEVYRRANAKREPLWPSTYFVHPAPSRSIKDLDWYDEDANAERLTQLGPGDWLLINNRNTADYYGNHSAVFIDWQDRVNWIARVAQLARGPLEVPEYRAYNLVETPLAHHSKPVALD